MARGEERDLSRYTAEDEKKVRPVFLGTGAGCGAVLSASVGGGSKKRDEEKEEHFQLEDVRFNKRGWIGMPCNGESRYGQSARSINPRRRFP